MEKLVAYVAVSAIVVWGGMSAAVERNNGSGQVTIESFMFAPQNLTIRAGTTVTWTNKDDVPHTVVSSTKKFRSGVLDTDGKFSFTFNNPGTYEYFCSVHPHMTGRVIVQ